MIDWINRNETRHILTIEDPVEFVHESKNSLIRHREVGMHTLKFHNALRAALREDPDVILVGEIRDQETLSTALEAAQTGTLSLEPCTQFSENCGTGAGHVHAKNRRACGARYLNRFWA